MLNLCFEPWGKIEEWKRVYVNFPGFDLTKNVLIVEENGKWVGGGTAWLREAVLKNGKKLLVYLAGDLYVHPDHRGKGIYSIAMKNLNKMASQRGAVLGFAFPSIYRVPTIALPKYGFVGIKYPVTKVHVLNFERFIDFLLLRLTKAYLPKIFDSLKIKLTISFDSLEDKCEANRFFELRGGQFNKITEQTEAIKDFDLMIKTNLSILLKIVSSFYLSKKKFLSVSLIAILRRELKVRFSKKMLKALLGWLFNWSIGS